MVAFGVNDDGHREAIGAAEGHTESSECWRGFLSRVFSQVVLSRMCIGN